MKVHQKTNEKNAPDRKNFSTEKDNKNIAKYTLKNFKSSTPFPKRVEAMFLVTLQQKRKKNWFPINENGLFDFKESPTISWDEHFMFDATLEKYLLPPRKIQIKKLTICILLNKFYS